MNQTKQPLRGTFVVSWGQTTIEGAVPGGIDDLVLHRDWRWTGDAVCLDARGRTLAHDPEIDRQHAAALARRILGQALAAEKVQPSDAPDPGIDRVFSVSDGIRHWILTLIELPELPRPLVMFSGEGPPPDRRLVVSAELTEAPRIAMRSAVEDVRGMVCFTPGTRIATESGQTLIEDLVAGDKVQTRDDGLQEILWIGQRRMSGARLHAMPDLRPVRIMAGALGEDQPDDDLVVSPDHRMLIGGARAKAICGEAEVLVAARDLIDDQRIRRDRELVSVSYIHLLLPRHQIVTANGMATESFHPADADLDMVLPDQRQRLFDVMPELKVSAQNYGARARPVLGAHEAAALAGRMPH